MSITLQERILRDPRYKAMVARRQRIAIRLSLVVLAVYFAYILIIGFDPTLFATPLWPGAVTTVGIPVGLAVIVMAFVVTGIYVRIANREFDSLNEAILKDHGR